MRNLFLALVLANLAFAAWHAWLAPAPLATDRGLERGGTAIKLLSEVEASASEPEASQVSQPGVPLLSEQPESVAEPGAAPAVTPPPADIVQDTTLPADFADPTRGFPDAARDPAVPRCVSVGPFRELSDAASAAVNLKTAGYDPVQRVAEGDIWVGYWVHIERIAARDEANAMLTMLRDNGVADSYLIPGEEDGDIISLGVFSELTRAGRLRDQVRQLGYEPVVVDRTRRGTVYWIDVLIGPSQRLDFEALQTPGRITRLEQRVCAPA